jgi:predicted RNA-binding protein with RPS1 domain/competence CoiA-like predicted nuclease
MSTENENTELLEIGADEIIDESNDSEFDSYETKRTIDEVLDKETGEIIKSEDFFKKPESEIIQYRRRLAEAILGYVNPKFVCSYCGQLVKLSGRQTRRGQVDFFANLYDSDDCEIKTNGEFSKEEIEVKKYGNIRESQRHLDLKNEIANALEGGNSKEIGIKNVEIEKRITSDVPYLYWRQPDIFAEFGDKNIVFELQLSTIFLSAIVDRDIFYRLHNTYIIWVFNFSKNEEYVNLDNLMCKDIYYANKRNVFIFDDKARELSKEEGQLVLLCIWFEPFIENGIFDSGKSVKKQEYIRLSDLKFDDDKYKPYYVDADNMFFKYQPELEVNRINLEELNINRIRRKEHLLKKKEDRINELKEQIKNETTKLQLFSKNGKYGFECNGVAIVEPTYSEVSEISTEGYIKVKKNKKYGFLNQFGELVLPCDYIEAFDICNNKCIVREKSDWYCVDIEKRSQVLLDCFNVEKFNYSNNLLKITYRNTHREFSEINRGGWSTHSNVHTDTVYLISMDGIKINIEFDEVGEFVDGKTKARKNNNWGYIDEQGNIIIPFEYSEIGEFINGKAKAKARKYNNWGYINEQGNAILEVIKEIENGLLIGKKFENWGIEDKDRHIIIPFDYERIEMMRNHFVVIKLGRFQLIKQNGLKEQTVKCSVSGISDFGVFLEFSGIKGLLHMSEIKRTEKNIIDFSKRGIENLYIVSADVDRQRISFSILQQEKLTPKHKTVKKSPDIDSYLKNSLRMGTITKIVQFGLFIRLEPGVHALLHVSELKKHNKSSDNFNVGDNVEVRILKVDKEKNRISLTLF